MNDWTDDLKDNLGIGTEPEEASEDPINSNEENIIKGFKKLLKEILNLPTSVIDEVIDDIKKDSNKRSRKNGPTPIDIKRAVAYDFPKAELSAIEFIDDGTKPLVGGAVGRLEFVDGSELRSVWLTINDFRDYSDENENSFFHDEYGILDYVCTD
jgi:hypothetical protein